jgi:hypothetical protein
MSVAQLDLRYRYEAKHDLAACADVAKLTSEPALQDAILWSSTNLASASQSHALATAALRQELSDSDHHRIALQTTRDTLWPHYLRVELGARAALLAPDPDAPLSADKQQEHERLIARSFSLDRKTLERESYEKTWANLEQVVEVCAATPALKPLKLAKGLRAALDRYGANLEAWQADQREDRDAQDALDATRATIATALAAHRLLIQSVLTAQGREAELGRFIRAADPAYSARRNAAKPIEEEPDAPDDFITQPIAET